MPRSAERFGYWLFVIGGGNGVAGEMMQFFPELKTLFRAVGDTLMQVNSEALDGGSRLLPECAPGGQSRGPITRRPSMMISRRVSPGIRARLLLRNLLEIITLDAAMGFLIRSAPGVGVFRFGVGPFCAGADLPQPGTEVAIFGACLRRSSLRQTGVNLRTRSSGAALFPGPSPSARLGMTEFVAQRTFLGSHRISKQFKRECNFLLTLLASMCLSLPQPSTP